MKNKPEFKKIAFALILTVCMGFVLWSYVLASVGSYEVNEGIATALIYTVIGAYASYVLASYSEKNSRNRYGIDVNGNRITEGGERGEL